RLPLGSLRLESKLLDGVLCRPEAHRGLSVRGIGHDGDLVERCAMHHAPEVIRLLRERLLLGVEANRDAPQIPTPDELLDVSTKRGVREVELECQARFVLTEPKRAARRSPKELG